MAIPFIASNEFLNPATAIDLTSSPQLVLTNNSTFTNADNLTTIEGEEVSGSGYARINLSVLSNSVQPGGDYKLIYDLAQITPSGGSIAFDRVVLISGSNWVGYWQYGTTTIANGQTYPFRGMTIQRTDQGTLVNGQNGLPAWTTTSASFTHPASIGQAVSVTVGQTSFMAVGSYVYFDDGVSRTQYKVTAIGSGTNATLERTTDEVVGGTTMQSGGKLVPSGKNGEDGVDGINSFGLAYTYSSTLTAPPSSGQVRLNNATLSSVTAIYASETDRNSVNISTILNGLNPGSILQLVDESTPTAWAIYQLNTLVDSGSYSTIGVTHIGSTGTFSGDVRLLFANKGNTGATGADGLGWTGGSYNPATGIVTFTSDDGLGFSTSDLRGATGAAGADGTDGLGWTGGSYNAGTGIVTFTSDDGLGFATGDLRGEDGITGFGLKYTFSATTTSPPNTQEVRLNNALPASATSIFIHETDRNSNNVASVLAALTVGSAIMILDESDPTAYALYTISSNTDNGTDRTIGVTSNAVGPGSFSGDVVVAFSIKGDTGATGSPGSVSAASEIDLTQISTPSDPGAGVTSLYAKNDGKVYYLPGGGVETLVGSSGTLYDAPAIVNSGTTYTTTGTPAIVPLTLDNNCTITLPTPPGSGVYNLEYWLYQDNTGGRAVTWASTGGTSIKWSDSATAPTIATSATYLTRMGFSIRNPDTIWRGLRVWQQIAPDPYFSSVVLQLTGVNFTDQSTNTKTMTASGDTAANVDVGGLKFFSFDGTGDALTTPANADFNFAGDFTIELWFRLTTWLGGNGGNACPLSLANTFANNTNFGFLFSPSQGQVYYYDTSIRIDSGVVFSLNTNHHLCVVRSSGVIKMYADGVKVGSDYSNAVTISSGIVRIGASISNTEGNITGYLRLIRITKDVARYTSNFTPPTTFE